MPTVSGARITTLILSTCNLTTIVYGRWSLVANQGEVASRSAWAFKLLVPKQQQRVQRALLNITNDLKQRLNRIWVLDLDIQFMKQGNAKF